MKLVFIKKRTLFAALIALAVTVVGISAGSASGERLLPIYSVSNDRREVALTFDSAWGDEDTDGVIAILKKYNVKASFFAVGSWVSAHPDSVRKLHDAGHSILNHSDSHPHLKQISAAEVVADAERCNDQIEQITGVRPRYYRAPYGEYDNKSVQAILGAGMYFVQWSADSIDWRDEYSPEQLADNVLRRLESGGIILCHNGAKYTLQELPLIIEGAKKAGYTFVTLEQLILSGKYTVDRNGRQQTA